MTCVGFECVVKLTNFFNPWLSNKKSPVMGKVEGKNGKPNDGGRPDAGGLCVDESSVGQSNV